MAGLIVGGQEVEGPAGLNLVNRMGSGSGLRNCERLSRKVTEVVLHETSTQSAPAIVAVLQQRGLGVHLIVSYDGTVYQHADLLEDETWHASEHNPESVGIEIVNPFEERYLPRFVSPWGDVIDAPWTMTGRYVVPTLEQCESVAMLLSWLTTTSLLSIPRAWVGLEKHALHLDRIPQSERGPGIYAHRYFADNPDGSWPLLYAWLRLEARLERKMAYEEAMRRATGVASVDLSDYLAGP